ncbi:MAG: copper homeostasis periplasmic binding protein CopC [Rhodomicrobium sp.]
MKKAASISIYILTSGLAYAHPALTRSEPSPDSTVVSPASVSLRFSEALIPKFSGAELKDQGGRTVEATPAFVEKDGKALVLAIQRPLAAGTYTVEWHAVAQDTHRVKGSYRFTVRP